MAVLASKSRRGLALPALRTHSGYFGSKTGNDRAWGDLLVALFTPVGSRPMRRSFGSGIPELFFSQAIVQDDPIVIALVRETAAKYCPHIQITAVRVLPVGNEMQVHVSFALRGGDVDSQLFQFERPGAMGQLQG